MLTPRLVEINYSRAERVLRLCFENDERYELSAEFLRVHSPSAEVRGHGPGQEVLQVGKAQVAITGIEPVGNYAVRLRFDDGHDSGIYAFDALYRLACARDELWNDYLAALQRAGATRQPS
ncbi:MAG: DUF971 domain-containing protein [Gammaproteobacteria bacterium]|nr:DUF971 domain-containing protein [Gammaproteobacteria bacterium]